MLCASDTAVGVGVKGKADAAGSTSNTDAADTGREEAAVATEEEEEEEEEAGGVLKVLVPVMSFILADLEMKKKIRGWNSGWVEIKIRRDVPIKVPGGGAEIAISSRYISADV